MYYGTSPAALAVQFIDTLCWCAFRMCVLPQAYNVRDAMNSLAGDKKDAANVAKVFFRDMEEITVYSRQKNGEEAMKAYNNAQIHLTKYLSLI